MASLIQWVKTQKHNIGKLCKKKKNNLKNIVRMLKREIGNCHLFKNSFVNRNSSKLLLLSAYFKTCQMIIFIIRLFRNLVNECLFWRTSFLARSNKAANIKCIFAVSRPLLKQIELPILSVCNKSVNCWLIACCHHALSLDGFFFLSLSFSMDIITYKLVPPSCCSGRYHGEYLGPAWKLLNEHKLTIFEKNDKF